MGFNNQGAEVMAKRLQTRFVAGNWVEARGRQENSYLAASTQQGFPLGINLGKSKITPIDEAATDYLNSFNLLKNLGDYFVVNVSSPNTPGSRSLQSLSN